MESLCVGGREKVVIDICNNLDFKKFDVTILVLSNDNNQLLTEIEPKVNIRFLPFKRSGIGGYKSIIFWLIGFPKLIKMLNEIKPNIVHTHIYYQHLFFVALGIRFLRPKGLHFRTVHTSGLFYRNKTWINRFRLKVEKYATAINATYLISISKAVHQNNLTHFQNLASDIRYIPNGIDLGSFNKNNFIQTNKKDFGYLPTDTVVTYIARFDIGKNHEMLIEAWAFVVKEIPNARLCLAGDGVLMPLIKEKCIMANLENSVRFLGTIKDVQSLLAISDIGVFPSGFEGFPLVLIEKMAMGLPVITSDIDIFKELIIDGFNGIISSVDDSRKFSEAIIKLLNTQSLRLSISNEAVKTAKQFSINNVIRSHQEYYEEKFGL
ncbi:MAG: glycosyltransferase [Bacteroidota bacterium]